MTHLLFDANSKTALPRNLPGPSMHDPLKFEPLRPLSEQELSHRQSKRQFYRDLDDKDKALHFRRLLTARDWVELLYVFDPTAIIQGFREYLEPMLLKLDGGRQFSAALRYYWRNSEENWRSQGEWEDAFRTAKTLDDAVTTVGFELARFNSLPNPVSVYRGCGEQNRSGLSWTISMAVAQYFAGQAKIAQGQGLVLCGNVQKTAVLAYMESQHQYELIIPPIEVENVRVQERI